MPATCNPNAEPGPDPARVEQTIKWLLTGARESDVLQAIETNWPGQLPLPLIQSAVDQLAASGDIDPTVVRGWCFEAAKSLYQKMAEIGDFAGALRAVKLLYDMAKQ